VLGLRFAAAPGLRLRRQARGAKLTDESAKVELEEGIGFAAPLPVAFAERIASLDGSRPLGEVLDGVEAAATARRLFALGLLVFPDRRR
jgi:hypothetical protein